MKEEVEEDGGGGTKRYRKFPYKSRFKCLPFLGVSVFFTIRRSPIIIHLTLNEAWYAKFGTRIKFFTDKRSRSYVMRTMRTREWEVLNEFVVFLIPRDRLILFTLRLLRLRQVYVENLYL